MTQAQYMTLIVGFAATIGSTIAAALIALLINNGRLNDVKDSLRAENRCPGFWHTGNHPGSNGHLPAGYHFQDRRTG